MTTFRGFPSCSCLNAWLLAYEAELLRRGVIRESIDIYQLIGGAAASAGTHRTGGAADLYQATREAIWVARNMGAASWRRDADPDDGQPDFKPTHQHLVLKGCEHNSAARYQIPACEAGRNGLGYNGRGGPDDGPRSGVKFPLRTWREGIAWAKAQATPKFHLRMGTWNLPAGDKLPNPAVRISRAAQTVNAANLAVIGWNELEPIKSTGVGSTFSIALDAALGSSWRLRRPTMIHNENYISYDSDRVSFVHQYDDAILPAATGGRHITRCVFRDKASGQLFAYGQLHLVNGKTAAHEADRNVQAARAVSTMKAVSQKHSGCPIIIAGDFNTDALLPAFKGWKRTREYADTSTTRNEPTYANIARTTPMTDPDWIIDQIMVTPDLYVIGHTVVLDTDDAGLFKQPRPSDHLLVITSLRKA